MCFACSLYFKKKKKKIQLVLLKAEAEIQEDAVAPRQKIVLIDDLLATGGEDSPLFSVAVLQ